MGAGGLNCMTERLLSYVNAHSLKEINSLNTFTEEEIDELYNAIKSEFEKKLKELMIQKMEVELVNQLNVLASNGTANLGREQGLNLSKSSGQQSAPNLMYRSEMKGCEPEATKKQATINQAQVSKLSFKVEKPSDVKSTTKEARTIVKKTVSEKEKQNRSEENKCAEQNRRRTVTDRLLSRMADDPDLQAASLTDIHEKQDSGSKVPDAQINSKALDVLGDKALKDMSRERLPKNAKVNTKAMRTLGEEKVMSKPMQKRFGSVMTSEQIKAQKIEAQKKELERLKKVQRMDRLILTKGAVQNDHLGAI